MATGSGVGRRSFLGMLGAVLAIRPAEAIAPPGIIIDFRADPDRACLYDVFDAATGENLNHLYIWYADEGRGIIRAYRHKLNERGQAILLQERGEILWDESRRDIRIRLKPRYTSESQGLAYNAEQWERFKMGLEADLP